jgi:hypothetical protein
MLGTSADVVVSEFCPLVSGNVSGKSVLFPSCGEEVGGDFGKVFEKDSNASDREGTSKGFRFGLRRRWVVREMVC